MGVVLLTSLELPDQASVDVNCTKDVFVFHELSTTIFLVLPQGYAIDMDDPESPTLRISYARALNNPKVKDGRANAAEEPSARAAEQRRGPQLDAYGAHRPHTDPRGGGRDMRGPPEQVGFSCSLAKDQCLTETNRPARCNRS